MEMKPGYKQTEVGVIPEDWEMVSLGFGIQLLSGQHVLANACNTDGDGVAYITGPADFPDGTIRHSKFTTKPGTICRPRDILLTVKGSGVGAIVLADAEYCISRQLMAIRVHEWDTGYIYYWLLRDASILSGAATGLIPGLSRTDILNKRISLPPTKVEQEAIASALGDADALIQSLEQLLRKNRYLKQAAMQELLTGKKRLPGFRGRATESDSGAKAHPADWVVVEAADIGQFKGGSGFPLIYQGSSSGEYPFFKVSDMSNEGNETVMQTANNYISEQNRRLLGASIFPSNAIIFAKVGAAVFLERRRLLKTPCCLDNNMAAFIISNDRVDERFIYYFFLQYKLGTLVSTTALPALSNNVLNRIEIALPPTKDEQGAIVEVLSDFDVLIAALEAKLMKARHIKLGLVQELLTGKVRLV